MFTLCPVACSNSGTSSISASLQEIVLKTTRIAAVSSMLFTPTLTLPVEGEGMISLRFDACRRDDLLPLLHVARHCRGEFFGRARARLGALRQELIARLRHLEDRVDLAKIG